MTHPRMEGGELKHQMCRCQPVLEPADALDSLACKAKAFRHQGGVEPEIGRHAAIGRDGKTPRLEERRDAGVAATVCN